MLLGKDAALLGLDFVLCFALPHLDVLAAENGRREGGCSGDPSAFLCDLADLDCVALTICSSRCTFAMILFMASSEASSYPTDSICNGKDSGKLC